ncbi:MAG: hypothetical protein L6R41_005097 [Letrouitia leprolyta]|nr:MAG: hypothetical protein L6R41_005097 [Letrouitia leprolyta]
MDAQLPGFKIEQDGSSAIGDSARIKVEPPSAAASPTAHSDDDIYEDAGDLDFSQAAQSLYLSRIPKYLWESWSKLEDDQEIHLGTIRFEGELDDIKRMSLLLTPNVDDHLSVPKEYNMHITNRNSLNTYVFTEKDLNGYAARDKPGNQSKASGGAFPSQAPRSRYQQRPGQNLQQRETTKRWQPYARTIPKQTALVGQIQTEVNCLPVENAEYKRTMDARTKAAMTKTRRETKMVEREPQGRVYAPTGLRQSNPFETGFTKKAKPNAGKVQQYKAARIPANELKDMIFECFKEYSYWPIRALKQKLDQPENYLRQVLDEIAQLVRNGTFANSWQLKPEYQESSYDHVKQEAAPVQTLEEAGMSAEDDDNVKMEDVLPT